MFPLFALTLTSFFKAPVWAQVCCDTKALLSGCSSNVLGLAVMWSIVGYFKLYTLHVMQIFPGFKQPKQIPFFLKRSILSRWVIILCCAHCIGKVCSFPLGRLLLTQCSDYPFEEMFQLSHLHRWKECSWVYPVNQWMSIQCHIFGWCSLTRLLQKGDRQK